MHIETNTITRWTAINKGLVAPIKCVYEFVDWLFAPNTFYILTDNRLSFI
uniref:Uncharacterized protein n=1 Tax=Daucus carota subsp. sativus TaxID=79200 RepID=A0A166FQM6_DAUCS